ncbi:hypothetical protein JCM17844_24840 [Iodidimonas gelatinilytica]|uniref:Uncharacterized protein n=1 Tax=Iodidimonas gelatinilytica TaxID=1236966 RepID=A0A5A7MSE0_9PROT|nr:Ig-like domain-containing protein [Iodidimonas gelatinilytica]GEQ98847.1 hypothetical protein JCM17844_24840 [Iodidimonas gelatinilytica]
MAENKTSADPAREASMDPALFRDGPSDVEAADAVLPPSGVNFSDAQEVTNQNVHTGARREGVDFGDEVQEGSGPAVDSRLRDLVESEPVVRSDRPQSNILRSEQAAPVVEDAQRGQVANSGQSGTASLADSGNAVSQPTDGGNGLVNGGGGDADAVAALSADGNSGPLAQAGVLDAVEDGGPVEGQLVATDVDGDVLTYGLVSGPAEGSVTVNADGSYIFDPADGFQDLAVGESRDVTFTYQVDDGNGGFATATVTITVTGTNDAPIAEATNISAVEDGGAVSGQLVANDVDASDTLSFSLLDGPAEGSVTVNADGSYAFDPADGFQDLAVGESVM